MSASLDPYNPDDAVNRLASAKPTCLAIFGHPNANTEEIAKRLAHTWRCELISPAYVVQRAVEEAIEAEKRAKKSKKTDGEEDGEGGEEEEKEGGEEGEGEGEEEGEEEPDEEEEEDEPEEEEEDGERPRFADPAKEHPPRALGQPSELATRAKELVLSGQEVPEDLVLKLMEERVRSDSVRFRGYVLEGLPSGPQARGHLDMLRAWPLAPDYVITVEMAAKDAVARAHSQRIDPSTGRLFWGSDTMPPVPPAPQAETGGEDEAEVLGDEEGEEQPAKLPEPTPLTVLPYLPIKDKAAKRLLRRPADIGVAASTRYGEAAGLVQAFVSSFSSHHRIRVNGNQALHFVVNDILAQLTARDLLPVVDAAPLVFEEDEGNFSTDLDLFEALARIGLEGNDGEEDENKKRPEWIPGIFGASCPVTLHDLGVFQRGKAAFAAGYRGRIYLCASEAARQKFVLCPSKYLAQKPSLPCFAVVFGDEASSPALAAIIKHITATLSVRLLDGSTLSPDASPEERVEALFGSQVSGGWILRNFPTNAEELHVMETKGITPNLVLRAHGVALEDFEAVFASNLEDRRIAQVEAPALADDSNSASALEPLLKRMNIILQNAVAVSAGPTEHDVETAGNGGDDGEEEDEELTLGRNPQYGVTGRFCPVALATRNVLFPGLPDTAARYRSKNYHFSSDEARDMFIASPLDFIQTGVPTAAPPFRAIFVGPTGAGKSIHARRLARRHRLLHISFSDRLRDLAHQKEYPHAEAIREHLASPEENALEGDVAMDVVKEFWDPSSVFGKSGFILEGFPRTEEEAKALCDAGLYPDLFVHMTCSPQVAERRMLPRRLREYQAHRARVEELRRRREEEKKSKAQARKDTWAKEQAAKKAEFLALKVSKREAEGDAYQSDGEEFAPEEMPADEGEDGEGGEGEEGGEEEQLQTDEEATSRIKEEIASLHDSTSSAAQSIADACKSDHRINVVELSGDMNEETVRALLSKRLDPFFTARQSTLFGSAYAVTLPRAEFLLANGYLQLSRLGTWCPSQLLQKKATGPLGSVRYPVVFNEVVYFTASKEDRKRFLADPLAHLAQAAPPVSVPLAVAVIGPPKSGKSLLAQRLASQFGAQIVTVESSWQALQEREPSSELLQRIDGQLREGTALTDQLCAELLGNALLAPLCQTRGYVLDGFPSTKQQLEFYIKSNQPLQRIFELELDEATSCSRSLKDHTASTGDLPAHDSEGIVKIRIKAFQEEAKKMREWCSAELRNWVSIDASKSRWWTASKVTDEAGRALIQHERHLDALLRKVPAPLCGIPVPKSTLQARLGPTMLYSPVSLVDRHEFVQTSLDNLEHTLEFEGKFYKLATEDEVGAFCASPRKYAGAALPPAVPRRRVPADLKAAFPKQLEFAGFCPVTYVQGDQRYAAIKQGEQELLAEYDGAFYSFASQDALDTFMKNPKPFHGLPLPKKLPPKLQPIAVGSLPMLGYMEQTASNMVTKAMTAVGLKRPKYPFLSAQQSAEVYIAMFLKANNPKSSDYTRSVWRARLRKFEETCDLLKFLGECISRDERDARPIDFDHKMARFLALTR